MLGALCGTTLHPGPTETTLHPGPKRGCMASQPCDGCGDSVTIGGGIANIWTFNHEPTGGLELELADGSEHFLCYDCIDRLPDDREVTNADVAALSAADASSQSDADGGQ